MNTSEWHSPGSAMAETANNLAAYSKYPVRGLLECEIQELHVQIYMDLLPQLVRLRNCQVVSNSKEHFL